MMTLKDVRDSIFASMVKKDLLYELTPENKILFEKAHGKFEAVVAGNGKEKFLVPETGTLHFLFRGQSKEYIPCIPTIFRGNPDDMKIFLERMRLTQFRRLLYSHPVVKHFFKRHNFIVDPEGLAQHYGLCTSVLDLTADLDIACFFATCPYDPDTDSYTYYSDTTIHEGVLYVFDPVFDNEPTPGTTFENYMRGNIRPIGLQAFKRPGVQAGYALHIPKGESTKSWIYRFTFTSEDSKFFYDKFDGGKALWVKDEIADKAKTIKNQMEFSFDVFNETFRNYAPKGYSKTKLKKAFANSNIGITFNPRHKDLVFTDKECEEIIENWNNGEGERFCETIVRKPWYNHEGLNEAASRFEGVHNRQDFNTFKHLSEFMLIKMIASPDGPIDAEWCNYMNTPRKTGHAYSSELRKIEACCNTVFGSNWLTEKDWHIPSNK